MMGTPAAGKTTIRKQNFSELKALDCDEIKASHPDYDPKDPGSLHSWSAEKLARGFYKALGENESFVYDGTGSTAEKYVAYIKAAQMAGFETHLVFVKTTLRNALLRNSKRERTVPEAIIREKHALIGTSFEIVSGYADHIEVVTT